MARKLTQLTNREWKLLVAARISFGVWAAEHETALELLDDTEREWLSAVSGVLDPANVALIRKRNLEAARDQAEAEQRQAIWEHEWREW
jgi:hypothetical protein